MRVRTGLVLACAAGLLPAATSAAPFYKADDSFMPGLPWWVHGYVEIGARAFLNDPECCGVSAFGGKSLAKYYEYSDNRPGPFLDGRVVAGSRDGLYRADFWARNVGYNDQRYQFDFSKAGYNYFAFDWNQIPHVYSTSAQTLYNGVGTGALTLPAGLSNQLATAAGGAFTPTPAQAAQVQSIINSNVHRTDIGIRRDTASIENRWTPTEAWDVRLNYSNTRRTGTQVDGVSFFGGGALGPVSQVTAPVADTTQNYGLSGEYAGVSPWGKKFTAKLGYGGSTYTDDLQSYTVQNPFCITGAAACAPGSAAPLALVSMPPSNQANAFTGTFAADLPMQSRYMGTVSYQMMRQNQAFQPFTINPNTGVLINGQNPASLGALPVQSLNGAVNTFLVNNVLTTQITQDVRVKSSYRYYNYGNDTPEIRFPGWVLNDNFVPTGATSFTPVNSLSVAYTKQNAGEELTWRPSRQWNIGAAWGFERYDWTRADVTSTNENSGKAFVDWKPVSWVTARASWLYGERRYENYDYLNLVGNFQWQTPGSSLRYSTAMRQFYLDNRDRSKGQFSLAVDLIHGLTVTPTFGVIADDYRIASNELGLTRNHALHSGVEVAYVFDPSLTFLLSYMNDRYDQQLRSSIGFDPNALAPANVYSASIRDYVNTYSGGINYALLPGTLDLKFIYTLAMSSSDQPVIFGDGSLPVTGQYPNVATTWQRFDASARYRFDPADVRRIGFSGEVYAKLAYAWERNSVTNWQNDLMQTYMYSVSSSTGYMTWLAFNNPNYNVHRLTASLAFAW
jgi:MtrB/PioB family decaheme-associated outer membrane protein